MKKMTRPAILLLIVLLSFACRKIKNLANINVDIPYSTQLTIPQVGDNTGGIPVPGRGAALNFPPVAVETNSKQYLAQYHTNEDNIRKVDLKKLSIQIITPPSQDFDFLDTVQLYIAAGNMPEVLVAYQYNIPDNATMLDFITITDINLKDYFLADTIRLRMRGYITAIPATGTQLKISSIFHMLANPLY